MLGAGIFHRGGVCSGKRTRVVRRIAFHSSWVDASHLGSRSGNFEPLLMPAIANFRRWELLFGEVPRKRWKRHPRADHRGIIAPAVDLRHSRTRDRVAASKRNHLALVRILFLCGSGGRLVTALMWRGFVRDLLEGSTNVARNIRAATDPGGH